MLKVLQIILQNSRANLAQAFLAGFVQCGLGLLLGNLVCMFAELPDGVKGTPVRPVLPLALSRQLLLQGINQEVISSQDKREPRDPNNHEPLEHGAEPTASPKLILADYSLRQATRGKAIVPAGAEIHEQKMAEERWSHAMRRASEKQVAIGKLKIEKREENFPLAPRVNGERVHVAGYPRT